MVISRDVNQNRARSEPRFVSIIIWIIILIVILSSSFGPRMGLYISESCTLRTGIFSCLIYKSLISRSCLIYKSLISRSCLIYKSLISRSCLIYKCSKQRFVIVVCGGFCRIILLIIINKLLLLIIINKFRLLIIISKPIPRLHAQNRDLL